MSNQLHQKTAAVANTNPSNNDSIVSSPARGLEHTEMDDTAYEDALLSDGEEEEEEEGSEWGEDTLENEFYPKAQAPPPPPPPRITRSFGKVKCTFGDSKKFNETNAPEAGAAEMERPTATRCSKPTQRSYAQALQQGNPNSASTNMCTQIPTLNRSGPVPSSPADTLPYTTTTTATQTTPSTTTANTAPPSAFIHTAPQPPPYYGQDKSMLYLLYTAGGIDPHNMNVHVLQWMHYIEKNSFLDRVSPCQSSRIRRLLSMLCIRFNLATDTSLATAMYEDAAGGMVFFVAKSLEKGFRIYHYRLDLDMVVCLGYKFEDAVEWWVANGVGGVEKEMKWLDYKPRISEEEDCNYEDTWEW